VTERVKMPELGTKFECAECGTKFYDLGNPSAACPKCGTSPKRDGTEVERKAPLARLPEVEEEEEVAVVADDEAVEEVAEEIEEEVVDADDE
jgi:uncharacterized protein (TIGR02300 family)